MTLTLDLTPEQERRVREEAAREGLDTETYAIKRLIGDVPQTEAQISEERERQIAAAKAGFGRFAHLEGASSDEFMAEKKREMALEDRF